MCLLVRVNVCVCTRRVAALSKGATRRGAFGRETHVAAVRWSVASVGENKTRAGRVLPPHSTRGHTAHTHTHTRTCVLCRGRQQGGRALSGAPHCASGEEIFVRGEAAHELPAPGATHQLQLQAQLSRAGGLCGGDKPPALVEKL